MNLNDLSTQLLYTTVPIWVSTASSEIRTGTGFFVNYSVEGNSNLTVPFLVTNKHVVEGAVRATLSIASAKEEKPSDRRLKVEVDAEYLKLRVIESPLDIVAFPFGPILNQLQTSGNSPFFRGIGKEQFLTIEATSQLSAVEEITFIGYPKGLIDQKAGLPLVRRGITASPVWNDFNGESCFVIDAGVFPGSSGSPVFLLNQGAFATNSGLTVGSRLAFLGILSESFISKEKSPSFLGLGKVINCHAVEAHLKAIVGRLVDSGAIQV